MSCCTCSQRSCVYCSHSSWYSKAAICTLGAAGRRGPVMLPADAQEPAPCVGCRANCRRCVGIVTAGCTALGGSAVTRPGLDIAGVIAEPNALPAAKGK